MLSPSDTLIIFVVALLLFGPEQLPKIARTLGDAMRSMQSTTHQFMTEMERAANASDAPLANQIPGAAEEPVAAPETPPNESDSATS